MSKTFKFAVTHSTASTKGGYINRLVTESKVKVLGVDKTTKHVYNMKTDAEVTVGGEFELDLSMFEIKTYTNEYTNADGVQVVGESRWLHEKLV